MNAIKDLPLDERPRERLIEFGASSLSNSELLAILLRTGTKKSSVMDLSGKILKKYQNLTSLNEATINELIAFDGMGLTKAVTLLACIELGKRVNKPKEKILKYNNAKDIYGAFRSHFNTLTNEEFWVLFLDVKANLIEKKRFSLGGVNQTMVDVKEICKWAIKYSSSGIILMHNHPSGDATPSKEDMLVTSSVIESCKMFNIVVCDHIIFGHDRYYSFTEQNLRLKQKHN